MIGEPGWGDGDFRFDEKLVGMIGKVPGVVDEPIDLVRRAPDRQRLAHQIHVRHHPLHRRFSQFILQPACSKAKRQNRR